MHKRLNAAVPTPPGCGQGANAVRTDWWQFVWRPVDQPRNPGLLAPGGHPYLWRIHAFYHGDCLSVPHADYRVGARLALEKCSAAATQQWWMYRSSLP